MIVWNNLWYLECYFGIFCGGMVCYMINLCLFFEQLIYIINYVEDWVIFFDKIFLFLIEGIREYLKIVDIFVFLFECDDKVVSKIFGLVFYEDFLVMGDENVDWVDVDENDVLSLCYIFGIIGNFKGVFYFYWFIVLYLMVVVLFDMLNIFVCEVMLLVVLMFYVNVWGIFYVVVMVGVKLVLLGLGFDGDSFVWLIDDEGVMVVFGVLMIW